MRTAGCGIHRESCHDGSHDHGVGRHMLTFADDALCASGRRLDVNDRTNHQSDGGSISVSGAGIRSWQEQRMFDQRQSGFLVGLGPAAPQSTSHFARPATSVVRVQAHNTISRKVG